MRKTLLALSLAAILLPVTACAAQSNASNADTSAGPSADVRAQITAARSDAKNASLAALSPDHKSKVQAIVDKFNAGSLSDPAAVAKSIDAVLTPDETTAVLAQETKMRAAMRAAYANGQAGSTSPRRGNASHKRTPDAGRFLLMSMASRDRLRAARTKTSN